MTKRSTMTYKTITCINEMTRSVRTDVMIRIFFWSINIIELVVFVDFNHLGLPSDKYIHGTPNTQVLTNKTYIQS